ncbi:MAG: trpF [Caulobacteraceae bacterium]|jgi:phosphoribosylanthranilate isomerase|nr:trpF [Caulobacteraceae bacterium]
MAATQAKICGLKTPEAVQAALQGGAAYLGFVFFDKSPRHLEPEAAARLAAPVRQASAARIVALTVDPSDAEIDNILAVLKPDLIQLHGRETPQRAAALRAATGLPVIKAVGVRDSSDIAAARAFDGAADHLMFDAKPPKDADRPGGHGASFDWTLLEGLRLERPWFLAGGLDPWNVAEAVRLSRAPLVDVSSGVERGPGVKDPDLIAAFLSAVRRA